MSINQFNIRVYGLLIDAGKILVTDEFRLGIFMTKFPGGGLHFGEGTIGCLKREFMEEMNMNISGIVHYYTTDYFQPTSLLKVEMQLFSIYYRVQADKPYPFNTTTVKNEIPEVEGAQSFRWLNIHDLNPDAFTFPIDRLVAGKLKNDHEKGKL